MSGHEKIERDLASRNRLEERGELVLEFTFGDVMQRFDYVATTLKRALAGGEDDPSLDMDSLSGIDVDGVDDDHRAHVLIDAHAWLASEPAREEALASCNRLRLAAWRLQRTVKS